MFRRLALVTSDFLQMVRRSQRDVVYTTPSFKGGRKFLTITRILDPENSEDPGYYYLTRTGRDSVGIVFYDPAGDREKPYILMSQWHGPLNRFQLGATTGSMDKPGLDAVAIAQEEAQEEVGYEIGPDQLHEVEFAPVSANTDESVHLFFADVTGLQANRPTPENIYEKNVTMVRCSFADVMAKAEWKAQVTVMQAMQRGLVKETGGLAPTD